MRILALALTSLLRALQVGSVT